MAAAGFSRMLIPLDGSKTSENVLPYARTLARNLQIPVEFMEAIDVARVAMHTSAEKSIHLDTLAGDIEHKSENYLRKIAESFSRTAVQCTVARGKAENAIIDKNARIGNNVVISPAGKPENLDHERYYIRDGIVIIPKDAVIPHGTVI